MTTNLILWVVCGTIATTLYKKKHKKSDVDECVVIFILGPLSLLSLLTAWIVDKYRK